MPVGWAPGMAVPVVAVIASLAPTATGLGLKATAVVGLARAMAMAALVVIGKVIGVAAVGEGDLDQVGGDGRGQGVPVTGTLPAKGLLLVRMVMPPIEVTTDPVGAAAGPPAPAIENEPALRVPP